MIILYCYIIILRVLDANADGTIRVQTSEFVPLQLKRECDGCGSLWKRFFQCIGSVYGSSHTLL